MTIANYPGCTTYRITATGYYAPGRTASLTALPAGVTQLRPAFLAGIVVEDPDDTGAAGAVIEIYDEFSYDSAAPPTSGFVARVLPREYPGAALTGKSWHIPLNIHIRKGLIVRLLTQAAALTVVYQPKGMSSPFNASNFIARR